jgi:hypothetical protein
LELLNFAGLVALKEREVEQLRTVAISVGTDTLAEAGANHVAVESGHDFGSDEQGAPYWLAFAAAGDLKHDVAPCELARSEV